ncbi:MAG: indolepyruvate oxidoreductase subunit beta [Promethearchaeota archaeon]
MIEEFNVVIAGVGGTGVLTIAHILGGSALSAGLQVVQSELHGMSQRGGSVSTHLRMGAHVYAPTFPDGTGDLLVGMEPIETLRNIKSVCNDGVVIFNTYEIRPLSLSILKKDYPSLDLLIQEMKRFCQNIYSVDATKIAKEELGAPIVANIVLLGAAMAKGSIPIDAEIIIEEIKITVPERFIDLNVQAFQAGSKAVRKL